MHVLIFCMNEDDSIKIQGQEWSQYFSNYKSMGTFPDAQGQLTPQSLVGFWPNVERISNFMVVLFTNEGTRMVTRFSPL